jgi:hypothetical protein
MLDFDLAFEVRFLRIFAIGAAVYGAFHAVVRFPWSEPTLDALLPLFLVGLLFAVPWGLGMWLLFRLVVVPVWFAWRLWSTRGEPKSITFTANSAGFERADSRGWERHSWSDVRRVRQLRKTLVIEMEGDRLAVPKSPFSKEELAELIRLAGGDRLSPREAESAESPKRASPVAGSPQPAGDGAAAEASVQAPGAIPRSQLENAARTTKTYSITEEQLIEGSLLGRRPLREGLIVGMALGVFRTAYELFENGIGDPVVAIEKGAIGGLLVGLVFWGAERFEFRRSKFRRQYRRNTSLYRNLTLALDELGYEVRSDEGGRWFPWSDVRAILDGATTIVIDARRSPGHILPKASFTAAELADLRRLAASGRRR